VRRHLAGIIHGECVVADKGILRSLSRSTSLRLRCRWSRVLWGTHHCRVWRAEKNIRPMPRETSRVRWSSIPKFEGGTPCLQHRQSIPSLVSQPSSILHQSLHPSPSSAGTISGTDGQLLKQPCSITGTFVIVSSMVYYGFEFPTDFERILEHPHAVFIK